MNQEVEHSGVDGANWLQQFSEHHRLDHIQDPEAVRLELVRPELAETLVPNTRAEVQKISNTMARSLPVIGGIFLYSESPSHEAHADAVFGTNEEVESFQLQLLQQTPQTAPECVDTARIPILVRSSDGREIYVYADYQHVAKLFPAVPIKFYRQVFEEKVQQYIQSQQHIEAWYEGLQDKGFPRTAFSRACSVETLTDEERATFLVEQQNLVEVNRTLYGFWIAAVEAQDDTQTREVAQQILEVHTIPDPTDTFTSLEGMVAEIRSLNQWEGGYPTEGFVGEAFVWLFYKRFAELLGDAGSNDVSKMAETVFVQAWNSLAVSDDSIVRVMQPAVQQLSTLFYGNAELAKEILTYHPALYEKMWEQFGFEPPPQDDLNDFDWDDEIEE